MREIDKIIIHCADTPNGKSFTAKDIDDWHQERGFRRRRVSRETFNSELKYIGYHYVLHLDGTIHPGRGEDEVGAHAEGYNSHSIGICLIGHSKYSPKQWDALKGLLGALIVKYPNAEVMGHYQVANNGKTCPNFDVPGYVSRSFVQDKKNVMEGV